MPTSTAEAIVRLLYVIILGAGSALVAELAIIAMAVFPLVAFVFSLAVCSATHTQDLVTSLTLEYFDVVICSAAFFALCCWCLGDGPHRSCDCGVEVEVLFGVLAFVVFIFLLVALSCCKFDFCHPYAWL